jgi:hypothetical protein
MSSSRRRVSPVAVAIAMGLGAAATGCNLVVSSGDYVVGNVDGGSSTSPDGSQPPVDGGEPGSDASDRPDGSAPPGEGGVSPEAGPAGDGGPAAACGPGGVLVPGGLPTADPKFQQIVNACVLTVSCDPLFFDTTISDCVTRDYLDAVYPDGCLAGVTSCAGYYACTGTRITTTAECQQAATMGIDVGTCSASGVATSCTVNLDGTVFGSISNCGASCTVYDESDFTDTGDTASGCEITTGCDASGEPALTCTSNNGLYVCAATNTAATIGLGSTCPVGSTCQTSNGFTDCYYTQPTCTTPGTRCAGGDLITCATIGATNQQYTTSCAATGLQCIPNTDGTASCAAPGCANSGCTEQCNGSQLELCIGGAPYPVDCASTTLGFATCASGSFNNLDYNYCAYQ